MRPMAYHAGNCLHFAQVVAPARFARGWGWLRLAPFASLWRMLCCTAAKNVAKNTNIWFSMWTGGQTHTDMRCKVPRLVDMAVGVTQDCHLAVGVTQDWPTVNHRCRTSPFTAASPTAKSLAVTGGRRAHLRRPVLCRRLMLRPPPSAASRCRRQGSALLQIPTVWQT